MSAPRVALVDYGMGNLHSVAKALERVGAQVAMAASGAGMAGHDALVLPGVGNFGDGIAQLHSRGLFAPVKQWIESGSPFLGICLGMQMLLERSEEAPGLDGLGVVQGTVKRFQPVDAAMKVPQMGWNEVMARKGCPLFAGVPEGAQFYFVHSYYAVPKDEAVVAGETEYGVRYCSLIWRGEMYACQFHPEKSQASGLRVLRNFVARLPSVRQGA